jgi:hypothetical protein
MSDSLVLERLREIRTLLGEVKEDTAELKLRIGMVELATPPCRCASIGWAATWNM